MMKNNQGAKQEQVVGTPPRTASSYQRAATSKPSPMFYLDLNSPDKDHIVDIHGHRIGISLPSIGSEGNIHQVADYTQTTQAVAIPPAQNNNSRDSGYKRKLFVEEDAEIVMDASAAASQSPRTSPIVFTATSQQLTAELRGRLQRRFPGGPQQLTNEFPGGLEEFKAKNPKFFRFSRKKHT